jgi:ADP-ribose pyrophosphatase YjhB (NUDIX family)
MDYNIKYMQKVVVGVGVVLFRKSNPLEVVIVEENKPRPDLGKRAGMFGLPAGHVEIEESVLESVRREVEEETGIDTIKVESFIGNYLVKGALGIVLCACTSQEVDLGKVDRDDIKNAFFTNVTDLLMGSYEFRPAVCEVLCDYMAGVRYSLDLLKDCR